MEQPLVSLRDVHRSYDGGHISALRGVTLDIVPGERAAIVGPSGSGKSTLLNMLSGIDRPTSGRVLFKGREPASGREWAAIRARQIGFVFQDFSLLPVFSAAENVQIPMFGVVRSAAERKRRAEDLLRRVGLGGRMTHKPSELSGGERQRVAIARSLANSPALILADEPTGNLDSRTSGEILDLLDEIRAEARAALVIVTHDPAVSSRAGRVVHILDGAVVRGQGRQ
ncbi:MAG: ABC transporter ATP-binding protein [Lentisphaerae bacterium]|nr:ABC transporter ATP-binding protein [Lentisphaerota bacterium]